MPDRAAVGLTLLGFLALWVVALAFLAVTAAQDGDYSTAAQVGGAGLVLLMFCFTAFKWMHGKGKK